MGNAEHAIASTAGAPIDTDKVSAVQAAVLAWFAENRRDLPWRHTRDPYPVLVSEVMLQQIQVARAIPFYLAFLARFPTVRDLAAAPLADAIRVWADLGRYKRVVSLHRTARIIVAEHGGVVPREIAALRQLPGIGPYTAGAIACFAYEEPVAFVDTNMRRVLQRLFVGLTGDRSAASEKRLQRLAEASVPRDRAWEWNQGLMEFGALHCTARRPRCTSCPVQLYCAAYPEIETIPAEQRKRTGDAPPPSRYEESNRYLRGRVLARLREHPAESEQGGVALSELGLQLRPGFSEEDLPWLVDVIDSLRKDGLAVAEERPVYRVGGHSEGDEFEVRVKLP